MENQGHYALYREWRPRKFSDAVHQEEVVTTLLNEVKYNRVKHAYLLCGTRGTGKTSLAKILAKAVNCLDSKDGEPCNECEMCKKIDKGLSVDVFELDAATNNGVANIRDIIDEVVYPPQEAKYKVYILDEVHMLSDGAVNAFLKTLEEPPARTIFILATTDPQQLPITILSRCERFDFTRIPVDKIVGRLSHICKAKGFEADEASLALIARMADGAMRDALSTLDQCISMGNGKVDYDKVVNMLGLSTNENLFLMAEAVIEKSIGRCVEALDGVMNAGKDAYFFTRDLLGHFRNLLMVKTSDCPEKIINASVENIEKMGKQAAKISVEEVMRCVRLLQEAERDGKWAKSNRMPLELAIIKMCKFEYDLSPEVLASRMNRLGSKLDELLTRGVSVSTSEAKTFVNDLKETTEALRRQPSINAEGESRAKEDKKETSKTPEPEKAAHLKSGQTQPPKESKITADVILRGWREILDTLKARKQLVLYASLQTGTVIDFRDGIVVVKFDENYAFNKDRLEKPEYAAVVDDVFSLLLRIPVKVKYVVDTKKEDNSLESQLESVFGSGMVEVLE